MEDKIITGQSLADDGTVRLTKIFYDYDGLGAVTKEVVYFEEGERKIGGTALCYEHDEQGRLVKVSWDTTYENMASDAEDPAERLPAAWLTDTCVDKATDTPSFIAEIARYWYDYKNRRVAERRYNDGAKLFAFTLWDDMLSELSREGIALRDYVWMGVTPVAQVNWSQMETPPPGGCTPSPGCQGSQCSIASLRDAGTKNGVVFALLFLVLPAGFYVSYRLKTGRRLAVLLVAFAAAGTVVVLTRCSQLSFSEPIIFWYHVDHLGTPIKMTNHRTDAGGTDGKVVEVVWDVIQKYPFGEFIWQADKKGPYEAGVSIIAQNRLRFPGQYFYGDRALILPAVYKDELRVRSAGQGPFYNYNRWYHPQLGRYLSADKLDDDLLYTYARNNPVLLVDILGLKPGDYCAQITGKRIYRNFPYWWGHWWLELGAESYGWYPEKPIEWKVWRFLIGVPGALNGFPNWENSSPTKDPMHGYAAEVTFHPKIASSKECKCMDCDQAVNCVRKQARGYKGMFTRDRTCREFQDTVMKTCCLEL